MAGGHPAAATGGGRRLVPSPEGAGLMAAALFARGAALETRHMGAARKDLGGEG